MKNNRAKKLLKTVNTLLTTFVCVLLLNTPSHAIETTTYYHHDGLGSAVAASDVEGNLLWREDYQPYGTRVRNPSNADNNLWFTGKPEEPSLGLQYFGARWYDPVAGRFTGIDPVGFKAGNIHSFNRYAYANNNPYGFVDPDGKESLRFSIEGNVPAYAMLANVAIKSFTNSDLFVPEGLNAGVTFSFPGLSDTGEYGVAASLDMVIGGDLGVEGDFLKNNSFNMKQFLKSLAKPSATGEIDFNWTKKT